MGAPGLTTAFAIGVDVLRTYLSDAKRTLLAKLGTAFGDGDTETSDAEWYQQVGFVSLPPAAGNGDACQCVVLRRGDHDAVVASRDLRGQALAGLLKEGETCVYAAGEDGNAQGRLMVKRDGAVTLLTTVGNVPGGASVYLRLSPDGLEFVAPFGSLKFDATGFHVRHASGARIDLGGIGGIPGADALGSYVSLDAAIAKLHGGMVMVGPKGAVYHSAAYGGFVSVPPTPPGAPISVAGFGAPIGLVTSGSVRIGT
jgi:hypothetical protein